MSADEDGIDIGTGKQLTEISVRRSDVGAAVMPVEIRGHSDTATLVSVTDSHSPNVGHSLHVRCMVVANIPAADQARINAVARRRISENRTGNN